MILRQQGEAPIGARRGIPTPTCCKIGRSQQHSENSVPHGAARCPTTKSRWACGALQAGAASMLRAAAM